MEFDIVGVLVKGWRSMTLFAVPSSNRQPLIFQWNCDLLVVSTCLNVQWFCWGSCRRSIAFSACRTGSALGSAIFQLLSTVHLEPPWPPWPMLADASLGSKTLGWLQRATLLPIWGTHFFGMKHGENTRVIEVQVVYSNVNQAGTLTSCSNRNLVPPPVDIMGRKLGRQRVA